VHEMISSPQLDSNWRVQHPKKFVYKCLTVLRQGENKILFILDIDDQ
jgi:hypothetical protein